MHLPGFLFKPAKVGDILNGCVPGNMKEPECFFILPEPRC